MNAMKAFAVAALLVAASAATPALAQEVITNPGKCAQYYPSANCNNYGPGNPYRGSYPAQTYGGGYQGGWQNGYAYDVAPTYRRHRYHHVYR